MLRAGAIILTLWAGVHLVIAVGILFMMTALGRNAPILWVLYGSVAGSGVESHALETINALAVLCNAGIAAMSLLALAVIWFALMGRAIWALWSLAACVLLLQGAAAASDAILRHPDPLGNGLVAAIPVCGLVFAWIGLSRERPKKA
jgi:hypothetical protein